MTVQLLLRHRMPVTPRARAGIAGARPPFPLPRPIPRTPPATAVVSPPPAPQAERAVVLVEFHRKQGTAPFNFAEFRNRVMEEIRRRLPNWRVWGADIRHIAKDKVQVRVYVVSTGSPLPVIPLIAGVIAVAGIVFGVGWIIMSIAVLKGNEVMGQWQATLQSKQEAFKLGLMTNEEYLKALELQKTPPPVSPPPSPLPTFDIMKWIPLIIIAGLAIAFLKR